MGVTVRQKVKGKGEPWYIFIHANRTISSSKIGDKRAALAVASALRKKMALGEFQAADSPEEKQAPTFKEFCDQYMKEYAKVVLKQNTWKGYEIILKLHLVPEWGSKRLGEITRADVKTLILKKQNEGLKPGTVQNILVLASGIFTYAVESDLLPANPAHRLGRYIRKEDARKDVRPLSREQVAAFLKGVEEHYPDYYALFLCAFRTGMRLGELLGLRWCDVNFDGNLLQIQRSYSHGHFSTPKSKKFRQVDMSDQLKAALWSHRARLLGDFEGKLPEPLFPAPDGGYIDGTNLRNRVFFKLLRKLDFPRFRIHDARHTFASLLLQQGAPIHYVRDQLGHASIQTTVDVYGHLVPGTHRCEVNRLDAAPEAPDAVAKASG